MQRFFFFDAVVYCLGFFHHKNFHHKNDSAYVALTLDRLLVIRVVLYHLKTNSLQYLLAYFQNKCWSSQDKVRFVRFIRIYFAVASS